MLFWIADVAALVAAVEADRAKLARFLSEFADDCTELEKFVDKRDSSSRNGSSSAKSDDVVIVESEAVSVVTVVLSPPVSSTPMILSNDFLYSNFEHFLTLKMVLSFWFLL